MCIAVPILPILSEARPILKNMIGTTRCALVQKTVPVLEIRHGTHSRDPLSITIKDQVMKDPMMEFSNETDDITQSRLNLQQSIHFISRADSSYRPRPLLKVDYCAPHASSRQIFARPLLLIDMSNALEMKSLEVPISPCSRDAVPWTTLCSGHLSRDITFCYPLLLEEVMSGTSRWQAYPIAPLGTLDPVLRDSKLVHSTLNT